MAEHPFSHDSSLDGQLQQNQTNSESRKPDIIIDGVFSVVFASCFIAVLVIATRNFLKYPQMVNRTNIVIVFLLSITLLSKWPSVSLTSPLTRPTVVPSLLYLLRPEPIDRALVPQVLLLLRASLLVPEHGNDHALLRVVSSPSTPVHSDKTFRFQFVMFLSLPTFLEQQTSQLQANQRTDSASPKRKPSVATSVQTDEEGEVGLSLASQE